MKVYLKSTQHKMYRLGEKTVSQHQGSNRALSKIGAPETKGSSGGYMWASNLGISVLVQDHV